MSATTSPAVSVLVVTYNQENYVRQALDGVLMQQTDFAFEVVVADDCSQDSTLDILREYQARHPEIRLLPGERNVGVTRNYKRAFAACRGEYVAILEGDDFWISPRKLELLYTFLRRHPECPLCFHRVIWLEEGSEKTAIDPKLPAGAQSGLLTASQLARGNFIRNASACMYRHKAVAGLEPGFWNLELRHWLLNLVLAQQGPIGYVPEILSVYRAHPGGVWSRRTAAEQSAEILKRIDVYNRYLGFKFDAEFGHARRAILRESDPIRRGIRSFVPPILLTWVRGIYERVGGSG
jgi:glycosyltransferase involved in cell wall biosynthesis